MLLTCKTHALILMITVNFMPWNVDYQHIIKDKVEKLRKNRGGKGNVHQISFKILIFNSHYMASVLDSMICISSLEHVRGKESGPFEGASAIESLHSTAIIQRMEGLSSRDTIAAFHKLQVRW